MASGSEARRDRLSAAALAVAAVAYLLAGRRYPLDSLAEPGPGIFPLAAGVALLALALWQLAAPSRSAPGAARSPVPSRAPGLLAGLLVLYAAALPRLGFLVTAFALVFVTARLMGLGGWWRPAVLALALTAGSRVLFGTWLGVPLP